MQAIWHQKITSVWEKWILSKKPNHLSFSLNLIFWTAVALSMIQLIITTILSGWKLMDQYKANGLVWREYKIVMIKLFRLQLNGREGMQITSKNKG